MTDSSPPLVLVTGASGFIATHVVQQLQEQGYRVRGTVRSLQNATKVEPLRQLCSTAKYPIELVEAELTDANSWVAAAKDCRYVIHVASPAPAEDPDHEDDLIKPAVDGTLNVLRACHEAGTVKRVVLTSSDAAVECGNTATEGHVYTEADWTDVEKVSWPYAKSKTLAERAAWDYVDELPETNRFELAVINPSYVFGPMICGSTFAVMEFPRRLLQREMPMLPHLNLACVDVRDVAAAHVAAMVIPEAAGHRHIVHTENLWLADIAKLLKKEFQPQGYNVPTTTAPYAALWLYGWFDKSVKMILPIINTENMWLADIAKLLRKEFQPQGYNVPTTTAPYAALWFYGRFDKSVKMILPTIGKVIHLDNSRMKNVLRVEGRDVRASLVDMSYSMIERGFIKKTSKYTRPDSR